MKKILKIKFINIMNDLKKINIFELEIKLL